MEVNNKKNIYRSIKDEALSTSDLVGGLDNHLDSGYFLVEINNSDRLELGLPLEKCEYEHHTKAHLFVTDSLSEHNLLKNRVIGQTLVLTQCGDGKTAIYNRSYSLVGDNYEWSVWSKVQNNVHVGKVTSLDSFTGNGVYCGTYIMDSSYEDFFLTVIDNGTTAKDNKKVRSISQFKYSLNLDGTFSFKTRIGHGNESVTWNSWVDIGAADTTDIQDNSITAQKLSIDVREKVTYVTEIKNNALQTDTVQIIADVDKINIRGQSLDETNTMSVDLPAATTEKAGVMSAEDKRLIYNWSKEFGKNLSGIYGSSEELNTGQYGFGVVYSGYTSGMIGKSIITKIKASIEPNTSAKLYFIKNDENGIITDIIIQDINREVLNKDTMLNIAIPAGYGVYLYGVEYINDSLNSTRYITRQNIRLGESAMTTFNGRFNFEIEVKTIPLEEEINPIKGSLDYVSVGFDIPRTKDSNNWSAIYSSAFEYDAVVTEVIYGIVDETLQLAVVSLDENNVVSEVTYHTFENVEHSGSLAVDIRVKKGDVLFIKNVKWDNSSDRYVVWYGDVTIGSKIDTFELYPQFMYKYIKQTDLHDKVYYSLNYKNLGFNTQRSKRSNKWTALMNERFTIDAYVTNVTYGISDNNLQLAVVSLNENNVVTEVAYHSYPGVPLTGTLAVDIKVKRGDILFIKNVNWDDSSDGYKVWYGDIAIGNTIGEFKLYPQFKYEYVMYSDIYARIAAIGKQEEWKHLIKYPFVNVYSSNYKERGLWIGENWTFSEEGMKPLVKGTITTNCIYLDRCYNADKRIARIRVVLNDDTVFSTGAKRGLTNSGEGESYLTIDCAEKKIKVYRCNANWYGIDLDSVLVETEIYNIVNGREYIVELEMNDYTFSVRMYDTVTGEDVAEEVKVIGWEGGRFNWNYFFVWNDGTAPVFTKFDVMIIDKPTIAFVGDSITEGVGMYDSLPGRYAEIIRNDVVKCIISAMGGANIDDVLKKFDSEFDIIKPKFISLCIGTNGGIEVNTENKFKTFIDNCVSTNIIPIINRIPCNRKGNYIAVNKMLDNLKMSEEYGDKFILGCAFDAATAVDNYPLVDEEHPTTIEGYETRVNTAMFFDYTHPNYAGSAAMAKRFRVDVPILLGTDS